MVIDMLTSMFIQPLETGMNTTCNPCTTAPPAPVVTLRTVSAWLNTARTAWARWLATRQPPPTDDDLTALDGLTAETLKDIGAPEWLQARAQRAQDRARQGGLFERESLLWR